MRRAGLLVLVAVLATAGVVRAKAPSGVELRTVRWNDVEIDVVRVDLTRAHVELVWQRAPGDALGDLAGAVEQLRARGEAPVAVTNAGIYGRDDQPLGLHVENGRELHPLDLHRGGGGNFYLKPNGVFYVSRDGAGIRESHDYAKWSGRRDVRIATQSGPLLVEDGRIHPRFTPGSTSRLVRSGVGVRSPTEIVLAVTRDGINFHDFARFFRDELGCNDALYLDGNISRLWAPALGREGGGWLASEHFVGMLAVVDGK